MVLFLLLNDKHNKSLKNYPNQEIMKINYTKKYYLNTIEKGIKKLLNCNSVPVVQLEEMLYMITELKKAYKEEVSK